MQLKASIKKELNYYLRSGKLIIIILSTFFACFALLLLFKFTTVSLQSMDGLGMQYGANIAEVSMTTPDENAVGFGELSKMYDANMTFYMLFSSIGMGIFPIIINVTLIGASGKEQKQKAHVIPSSLGLRSINYVSAKFLIYPITVFLTTFLSILSSGLLTLTMFENTATGMLGSEPLTVQTVVLLSLGVGVFNFFLSCVSFTIGLSTARAGIGALCAIVGPMVLGIVFQSFNLNKYHPFSFDAIGLSLMTGENAFISYFVTVVVTLILSAVLFFVTVLALQSREIRNYEDRPEF